MRITPLPRADKSLHVLVHAHDGSLEGHVHKHDKRVRAVETLEAVFSKNLADAGTSCQIFAKLHSLLDDIARRDEEIMCYNGKGSDGRIGRYIESFVLHLKVCFEQLIAAELEGMSGHTA